MTSKISGNKLKAPGRMNVKLARVTSIGNVAGLVLAGLFFLTGFKLIGYLMLSMAMLFFCLLIGTGVYRIAGGKPLDEIEKDLMQRGYYWSYWIIGTLLILGILVVRIVGEVSTLMLNEDVHEFLFWAVMSFVIVVPAAVLSWIMPTDEIDPDEI